MSILEHILADHRAYVIFSVIDDEIIMPIPTFKKIWDEMRETYSQAIVGSYAALWGEQLVQNPDGEWESQPSPYKYMRNDRRETASDTWAGWSQLVSAITGGIGLAVLAGAKELSITVLPIYVFPILFLQTAIRVVFNSRELEGAQNRNLNKKSKTSINVGIMLAYAASMLLIFLWSTLATIALPLIVFGISIIRSIQAGVYAYANFKLRRATDPMWDPLQRERYRIQEFKRDAQLIGASTGAGLSGFLAFGEYTIGLPVLFWISIGIGALSAGITLYLGLREISPVNNWFRDLGRLVFRTPQLRAYDPINNEGYVQSPVPTLESALPPPSAHQVFLRNESWWLKKVRLLEGKYYHMTRPPTTLLELDQNLYPRKTPPHLFAADICQELEAIFQCHPKEKEPGELINENNSITVEAKKDLGKRYMLSLIDSHKKALERQLTEAKNITWFKKLKQILNFHMQARVEQLQDKIALLKCLYRLVETDNGINETTETHLGSSEALSPFEESLNQCYTYDDVESCLIKYPQNMRNACQGAHTRTSSCETLFRILSPAKPTATYENKGYFCLLNEYKQPQSSLTQPASNATMLASPPESLFISSSQQPSILNSMEGNVAFFPLPPAPPTSTLIKEEEEKYEFN